MFNSCAWPLLTRFADPLPDAALFLVQAKTRLPVTGEPGENCGHRSQRVFVTRQQRRVPLPDVLTNFLRSERVFCFHQDDAAGLGKSGLPLLGLAIHQPHQLGTQRIFAKNIGQPHNCLANRPDALHDLGPLFQQSLQFGMHLDDDLFDVSFTTHS